LILEVAVIVLFLFWAGTLAMFLAYIKAQRVIAAQQAQGDALRDQRIKDLAKRVDDYQNGNVRMGEALHDCARSSVRCRTRLWRWNSATRRACRSPRRRNWWAWARASMS
jgi:hypothetical protein